MKFALCEKPEEPELSDALWTAINATAKAKKPKPSQMFIGMDYHLNWLYAALATANIKDLESEGPWQNEWMFDTPLKERGKDCRPIQNNQEDIDLLIAWMDEQTGELHLALIEAKLDSSWSSEQFKSKKKRLTLMKTDAVKRGLSFVKWEFFLISPGRPPKSKEFAIKDFNEEYLWLLGDKKGPDSGELSHRKLPVNHTLRRVKRTSKKSKTWDTYPSIN